MKAIITGSTGMVGKGVLLECLDDPNVSSVLIVNRSSIEIKHPKLTEILIEDFFDLGKIENELAGYNACFFCLGTSSAGKKEESYHKITFDLTLHFAKTLLRKNPQITFCYVSGAGTDSTEKGRSMWARVKGKTENALLKLPFKAAYMFRPGFIQPMKGVKSKTKIYNAIYLVLKPLFAVLKVFPKLATNTEKFGKAMINVVVKGYDKSILEIVDINLLAQRHGKNIKLNTD